MRTASVFGLAVTTLVILLWPGQTRAQAVVEPWDTNLPIVNVQKEVFRPAPLYDVCQYGWAFDVGPDGQKREVYFQEGTDDVHTTPQARYWDGSAWLNPGAPTDGYTDEDLDGYFDAPHEVQVGYLEGYEPPSPDPWPVNFLAGQRLFYDSGSGAVIRLSQCFTGGCTLTFYDLSLPGDPCGYGRHFETPKLITPSLRDPNNPYVYQQDTTHFYDPQNSALADYGYYDIFGVDNGEALYTFEPSAQGMNTIRLSDGRIVNVITRSVGKDTNGATVGDYDTFTLACAAQCLIGEWDPNLDDYNWTWSNAIVGDSALGEATVAQLSDGSLLVDFRHFTTDNQRRFSRGTIDPETGAITLSEPDVLRYDDGLGYDDGSVVGSGRSGGSGGSYAQLIRSSQTGKLYFIGNLEENPSLLRSVLGIAEVDESGISDPNWKPRLKKDSVTLIDMKQGDQSSSLALSNFVVRENQATGDIEVYVSPLGGAGEFRAPALMYTLETVSHDSVRAIYRETFRYSSPAALNAAGWNAHVGPTAWPRGSLPTDCVAIVNQGGSVLVATNSNCESGLLPTALGGCVTDDVASQAPQVPFIPTPRHIMWTDEYKVDSSWVVSEVRWEQDGTGTEPHFAAKIGDDWYVTDQVGALKTDRTTFDEYSIDLATATWRDLTFDVSDPNPYNHRLGPIGDTVSLPCGDIQAFGLYVAEYLGGFAEIDYDNISLWARQLYEGDLNGDGFVGAVDLDIFRANYGQYVTPGDRLHGDCSGDGFVGGADLDTIRAQWGLGTPPGPVPEPSTFVTLCGAALMGLYALARRRRRT